MPQCNRVADIVVPLFDAPYGPTVGGPKYLNANSLFPIAQGNSALGQVIGMGQGGPPFNPPLSWCAGEIYTPVSKTAFSYGNSANAKQSLTYMPLINRFGNRLFFRHKNISLNQSLLYNFVVPADGLTHNINNIECWYDGLTPMQFYPGVGSPVSFNDNGSDGVVQAYISASGMIAHIEQTSNNFWLCVRKSQFGKGGKNIWIDGRTSSLGSQYKPVANPSVGTYISQHFPICPDFSSGLDYMLANVTYPSNATYLMIDGTLQSDYDQAFGNRNILASGSNAFGASFGNGYSEHVIFDNPALQSAFDQFNFSTGGTNNPPVGVTSFGFIIRTGAVSALAGLPTFYSGAGANFQYILISKDCTKYAMINFKSQSATAKSAVEGNAYPSAFTIDPNGIFYMIDPVSGQMQSSLSFDLGWNEMIVPFPDLLPFTLPCFGECASVPLNTGIL